MNIGEKTGTIVIEPVSQPATRPAPVEPPRKEPVPA